MRLEDLKRRHAKPRSLATGDIAVVIDLLIRRIGEGLGSSDVATKPPEVEESEWRRASGRAAFRSRSARPRESETMTPGVAIASWA
jgi:hypothetical protein